MTDSALRPDQPKPVPVTPAILLAEVRDQLDLAITGSKEAAFAAHAAFHAFLAYMNGGSAETVDWNPEALVGDQTVEVFYEDGNWVAEVDDPTLNFVEDDDHQMGMFATEALQARKTVDEPAADTPRRKVSFPVTRHSPRGKPRAGSAATSNVPLNVRSMLGDEGIATGTHSPMTSHTAVKAMRSGTMKHKVFWLIASRTNGLTDYETEQILMRTSALSGKHQSVSGARNRLMRDGYVEDSGKTRLTDSKSPAIVWVVTEWARQRIDLGEEIAPLHPVA